MDTKILEDIGFSRNEIKVYFALLDIGVSSSGPIAKNAGIPASKIYTVIDKLISKGLVACIIKNNVKYFEATNPRRLKDYVSGKKENIERQEKEIEKMLPVLEQKKKNVKEAGAIVYEGYKGVKTVFDNILEESRKGDEVLVAGAGLVGTYGEISKTTRPFFDQYHSNRTRKGIRARILFNSDAKEKYGYRSRQKLTQVRYLPKNTTMPAQLNIYNDKVITVVWHKVPIAVVLTDREIAKSYKQYFELLWKQGNE